MDETEAKQILQNTIDELNKAKFHILVSVLFDNGFYRMVEVNKEDISVVQDDIAPFVVGE